MLIEERQYWTFLVYVLTTPHSQENMQVLEKSCLNAQHSVEQVIQDMQMLTCCSEPHPSAAPSKLKQIVIYIMKLVKTVYLTLGQYPCKFMVILLMMQHCSIHVQCRHSVSIKEVLSQLRSELPVNHSRP